MSSNPRRPAGEVPGVRRRVHWDRPDQKSAMWSDFHVRSRKGKSWKGCEACPPERRDPNAKLDSHHVIDQADLRAYARDHSLPPLRLLQLLTDPRNSMLVCGDCHHGHTSRMRPIAREHVPDKAWKFARELGMEDYIMERYR